MVLEDARVGRLGRVVFGEEISVFSKVCELGRSNVIGMFGELGRFESVIGNFGEIGRFEFVMGELGRFGSIFGKDSKLVFIVGN